MRLGLALVARGRQPWMELLLLLHEYGCRLLLLLLLLHEYGCRLLLLLGQDWQRRVLGRGEGRGHWRKVTTKDARRRRMRKTRKSRSRARSWARGRAVRNIREGH